MNNIVEAGVTIALAIVGLAIVSVLVSKNAQTSSVVQSLASGFSNAMAVAQSPVSGARVSPNLGYPSQMYGGLQTNLGFGFGS
jgi:hypothetical protein